jgi:hypothetical protein
MRLQVDMAYNQVDEEWHHIRQHLPAGWEQAAYDKKAIKIAQRSLSDPERLLRVLLGRAASNGSLRAVAGYAREAGLANVSNVAVFKRERKCGDWLEWIADHLLAGTVAALPDSVMRLRLVDATAVSKPGSEGTDFRLHVNVELPSRRFVEAELTDARGGESFKRFKVEPGDLMVGDRAYGTANGIQHVVLHGGHVLVRTNGSSLPLLDEASRPVDPLEIGRRLVPGEATEVPVQLHTEIAPGRPLVGRLLVQALPIEQADKAQERVRRSKNKGGGHPGERAIENAKYVYLFTTAPAHLLTTAQALATYRLRWQIELSFKTMKSAMKFSSLPNRLPQTGRTWLLGKLVCALLLDRLLAEQVDRYPPLWAAA